MECQYHKKKYTINEYSAHLGCVKHGHCLNPVQCPLFKNCPTHINGGKRWFSLDFFFRKFS